MKQIITILFCLLLFTNSFAQNEKVLTINDFIEKVRVHHPLAKVANIQIDKAEAKRSTILIIGLGYIQASN